jgi:hypothetical protein
MTDKRYDDVGVVVRESGERTANACCGLLTELLGETVHRVSARPFSATLRKSLELGERIGRPWTLCIDGDVLPLTGLKNLVEDSRALSRQTFVVQGLIIDKLLPVRRPAGNHLYRTEHIGHALSLIPDEEVLRPESEMILRMRARGYGFYQAKTVMGLHDFEQSLADVYAKAYLHSRKHGYFKEDVLSIWNILAGDDIDYAVALSAWRRAEEAQGEVRVCRDYTDTILAEEKLTLESKPDLRKLLMTDVEYMLAQATVPDPRIEFWREHLQSRVDAAVFSGLKRGSPKAISIYHRLLSRWRALRSNT